MNIIPIKNYENKYLIRSDGVVINNKTNRQLKPSKQTNGYLIVSLSKNNIKHTVTIHRLVAEHFIKNPNKYNQINHIDENKNNNSVENLEWCSCQMNIDHSFSKKVYQYDKFGNIVNIWKSAMEASRNGYNQGKISACCRLEQTLHKGYRWSYNG